jgi:hypothetical protein
VLSVGAREASPWLCAQTRFERSERRDAHVVHQAASQQCRPTSIVTGASSLIRCMATARRSNTPVQTGARVVEQDGHPRGVRWCSAQGATGAAVSAQARARVPPLVNELITQIYICAQPTADLSCAKQILPSDCSSDEYHTQLAATVWACIEHLSALHCHVAVTIKCGAETLGTERKQTKNLGLVCLPPCQ